MAQDTFDVGSGLEVPGLEATFEYGDADSILRDTIPGVMRFNDRSGQEWVRIGNIDGLHGDPDGRDTRDPKSDQDGEDAGLMRYGGRTIGLTGETEAGSIPAMRDLTTRFFSQFGKRERDLLIHVPDEVQLYVNEVTNPAVKDDTFDWFEGPSTTLAQDINADGQPIVKIGGSSTTAISVQYSKDGVGVPWSGEDVWVGLQAQLLAGPGAAAVDFRVQCFNEAGGISGGVIFGSPDMTEAAATTAQGKFMLSHRVLASDVHPATKWLVIQVNLTGSSGTWSLGVWGTTVSLIDGDQASPSSIVVGSRPGYEWEGPAYNSRSYGPCYSTNMIADPTFENKTDFDPTTNPYGRLANWRATVTLPATITIPPISTSKWRGDYVPRSTYFKITKDASATTRDFQVVAEDGNDWLRSIAPGALHRVSLKVNVLTKPATGTLTAGLTWAGAGGGVLATSGFVTTGLSLGINDVVIESIAPEDAKLVRVGIFLAGCTTSSGVLEAYISDPCFVDISDYDPSTPFFGLGESYDDAFTDLIVGPRRRIPRPFLVKMVRKTSDAKAPESQQDRRYRRAFTMSLRAADPRLYVLDERRSQVTMSGDSLLTAIQSPDGFVLEGTGSLATPTGYTAEGGYITPSGGKTFRWSNESASRLRGPTVSLPLGGVAMKSWSSASDYPEGEPTSDFKARYYRSAEGVTYTEPKVIVGGAPNGHSPTTNSWSRQMGFYAGGSPGSLAFTYNTLAILLKRVSSTVWLEMRWNSASKAAARTVFSEDTNAPNGFELWCSHNTSGTLGTTKLEGWEYTSTADAGYPFRPATDPMWITSWMLDDVVYWELWSTYPNLIDITRRVESGSFALPAGLQSVVGSAVAGSAGWSHAIKKGATPGDGTWAFNASLPPYIHYYESSDASTPPVTESISVIGSIETPQIVELRGDLVDPIVQITVPEFDDQPQTTSVARFQGIIDDSSPIFIDLADSSVRDAFGVNRRDLLVPGSRFEMFRPGVNKVTIQAKSWGDYPTHTIVSHRDALR